MQSQDLNQSPDSSFSDFANSFTGEDAATDQSPASAPEAAQAAPQSAEQSNGDETTDKPLNSAPDEGSDGETQADASQVDEVAESGGATKRQRDGILAELKETRAELKARRDREAATAYEMGQLQAQLQMLRQQMQPQATPQQQVQVPDPAMDPEGYHRFMTGQQQAAMAQMQAQIEAQTAATRFQASMTAHARSDAAAVQEAVQWVQSQGEKAGRYYTAQTDPIGAAMADYRKAQALHQFGTDPAAYEKAVEAKIMAKIAAQQKQAKPAPKVPATLANQTRGGNAAFDETASFKDWGAQIFGG